MVLWHIVVHALAYGAVVTGYLFLCMISVSPRVWGYHDYPPAIKQKVPAQTRKEKIGAAVLGIPWIAFVVGFPVWSSLVLEGRLGGHLPFLPGLANVLAQFLVATVGDLVVLDWLIVSRLTPSFVVIPGTVKEDYRDFSHHFRAHAKAAMAMVVLGTAIVGALWWW